MMHEDVADTKQLCPYCGYEKDLTEFTDEHVLPRALGGGVRPTNPFVCRVCGSCNAAVGRWIDGWFTRSPLIYNFRARASFATYDPDSEPTFPLFFFGSLQDWSPQAGVHCDFWLGPTGDHIFHFHRPYEDRSAIFAGVPPHLRSSDVDPGNVFVRVVGTNHEWHPIIWRSVRAAFEPSAIHLLNAAPPGHTAPHPPPVGVGVQQYQWIRARPQQSEISNRHGHPRSQGSCRLG